MSRRKRNVNYIAQKRSLTPKNSKEQSSFSQEVVDNDNSVIQEKLNEETLSSILACIATLENENKVLKAKTNKEAIVLNNNTVSKKNTTGKNIQRDINDCMITKKTSKKQCESILEQISSEQESDDIEVRFECNKYIIYNLYYLMYICLPKDNYNITDKDNNKQFATRPIPKLSNGLSRFANLHLKLNIEKSVYESYRVSTINIK